MLKAIHAQESKKAFHEKAKAVVAELRVMKLKEAIKKVEDGIEETLTYCDFPSEHWTRIRTNNVIEQPNREIRRWTQLVGTYPDGNSALMLVYARLRHVAGPQRNCKKHMNMALGVSYGRRLHCWLTLFSRSPQTILRINLDGTSKNNIPAIAVENTLKYIISVLNFPNLLGLSRFLVPSRTA